MQRAMHIDARHTKHTPASSSGRLPSLPLSSALPLPSRVEVKMQAPGFLIFAFYREKKHREAAFPITPASPLFSGALDLTIEDREMRAKSKRNDPQVPLKTLDPFVGLFLLSMVMLESSMGSFPWPERRKGGPRGREGGVGLLHKRGQARRYRKSAATRADTITGCH